MTMLQRARKHISPATIVAIVALVFAVTGGAFAATGQGGSGRAKASGAVDRAGRNSLASAAKSKGKVGPRGPRGPAGPAGKSGANGAPGATGPAGPAGAQGIAGSNGSNGEPVAIAKAGAKECPDGGTTFSNATGTSSACNGEASESVGESGLPVTLPEGKTETGIWASANIENQAESYSHVAISFPVPLEAPLTGFGEKAGFQTHYVTLEEQTNGGPETTECKGSVEAPSAKEGNLCVYQGATKTGEESGTFHLSMIQAPSTEATKPKEGGAGTAGAVLVVVYEGPSTEVSRIQGSWAVTAPAKP